MTFCEKMVYLISEVHFWNQDFWYNYFLLFHRYMELLHCSTIYISILKWIITIKSYIFLIFALRDCKLFDDCKTNYTRTRTRFVEYIKSTDKVEDQARGQPRPTFNDIIVYPADAVSRVRLLNRFQDLLAFFAWDWIASIALSPSWQKGMGKGAFAGKLDNEGAVGWPKAIARRNHLITSPASFHSSGSR